MHPDPPPLYFYTRAYQHMRPADRAAGRIDAELYPDGETGWRVDLGVADRHAVLVGGTISDRDTLEIHDLAYGLVMAGAVQLTLLIPYFGYATAERAVHPGEIVMAKVRARLFSCLPATPHGNRVVLLDLHSEGITHYFEAPVQSRHVYAKPVIRQAVFDLAPGDADLVVGSTDAGRAKWVESLANDFGVMAAFIYKRRVDARRVALAGVNANVAGRTVVVYDDMVRSGGSLLNAAHAYREAGARTVCAVVTHGVLPGDSVDQIRASGLVAAMAVTDSHPGALRARDRQPDFLRVYPVAPLLESHVS